MHCYKSKLFDSRIARYLVTLDQNIHQLVQFLSLTNQLSPNFQEMHYNSPVELFTLLLIKFNTHHVTRFLQESKLYNQFV